MREYIDKGYRPFPVLVYKDGPSRVKQPLVAWQAFQRAKPTLEDLAAWEAKFTDGKSGIGLATGQGLVVIDLDADEPLFDERGALSLDRIQDFPWLDPELLSFAVRTPGGGIHIYCCSTLPMRNAVDVYKTGKHGTNVQVDIRGDGGFVVAPPTRLWDGDQDVGGYTWLDGEIPEIATLPPFPENLAARARQGVMNILPSVGKIGPGIRNDSYLRIAMSWVSKVRNYENIAKAKEGYMQAVRDTADMSGFDESEAEGLWESAVKRRISELGPEWTVLGPAVRKAAITTDLNEWPFTINLAVRIGDQLELTVILHDKAHTVVVPVDQWLTQARFKTCFFKGTGVVLPSISNKAYEAFIQGVEFERITGNGADIEDDIIDTLRRKVVSTSFKEDNEDIMRLGYGMKEGVLAFRTNALANEFAMKAWSKSSIVLALRKMAFATQVLPHVGEVWLWKPDVTQ